jgi:hypothetical protein
MITDRGEDSHAGVRVWLPGLGRAEVNISNDREHELSRPKAVSDGFLSHHLTDRLKSSVKSVPKIEIKTIV